MKKTHIAFFITAGTIVLVTSGCSSSSDSPKTAIPMESSVIRTYQQGDTITTTMTLKDTTTVETAAGELTITIGTIVPNPYGIDCRAYITSGTVTGTAGTFSLSTRDLFYQDANNSLYNCGTFDDTTGKYIFLTETPTTPNGIALNTKSPVQLGDSTSVIAYSDDGTWEDCTTVVQSKENINVPPGLYESYRIYETCTYSDGTSLVNTIWMVPGIFNLKESGQYDGFSAEFTVTSYTFK